jgi:hypothetical protein
MRTFTTLALLFAFTLPGVAADKDKKKRGQMDEDVKKATAKALEWLAAKQDPKTGAFGDQRYPNNMAITGFTLMAFMSQGNVPNEGKYGPEVAKGLRFILANARDDGYLAGTGAGTMYNHGMATLALSQLFGMTGDEEVKKVLKKAVDLTIRCQSPEGGWRYEPAPTGADISVTIMQVMALRGAKDSGLNVPDKTLKKALEYVNHCYDEYSGGYTYQPYNRAPGFARTAAGVCVVKLTGEYDKNVDKSVAYLKQHMERPREHYWYGHYYACHAFYQVGGKDWEDYYSLIKREFLSFQQSDGSFSGRGFDPQSPGPVYQTAIAVIALSVPADYLPIFQR